MIQLGDLLPYINENETVYIWAEDKMISEYNGKDSIPVEHNKLYICEGGIEKGLKGIRITVIDH